MPMYNGTCPQCDEKDARIVHLVTLLQKSRKIELAFLVALAKYGTQVNDLFGHDEELTDALAALKKNSTEP